MGKEVKNMERLNGEYPQFTEEYKRVQEALSDLEQRLPPGERNLRNLLERFWEEKAIPRRKLQSTDYL